MPRYKVVPDFKSEHPVGSKEWHRDYQRARRKTPTGRMQTARSNLEQMHGLTFARYEEIYEKQRGLCAICGKGIVRAYTAQSNGQRGPKKGGACVDHDHSCCAGQRSCGRCVRGLLCHHCNIGVGVFRDKPDLMRAAIEYITRWRWK